MNNWYVDLGKITEASGGCCQTILAETKIKNATSPVQSGLDAQSRVKQGLMRICDDRRRLRCGQRYLIKLDHIRDSKKASK